MKIRPKILGQLLLDARALSREHLDRALEIQREEGGRLGELLVRHGLAPEGAVWRALAAQVGL
ncbi:MAG TPA: hypothetical protein VK849_13825, partial [Longimicrobiales bacterium]|nr:hypothetical protein [Longimicrobiales bacterium]